MLSSTSGYCDDIFPLQVRHRPLRIRKLRIGIFSYQWSGVEHLGQCEAGKTIDSSGFGSLKMTTLRKEPTTAPNRKVKIEKRVST